MRALGAKRTRLCWTSATTSANGCVTAPTGGITYINNNDGNAPRWSRPQGLHNPTGGIHLPEISCAPTPMERPVPRRVPPQRRPVFLIPITGPGYARRRRSGQQQPTTPGVTSAAHRTSTASWLQQQPAWVKHSPFSNDTCRPLRCPRSSRKKCSTNSPLTPRRLRLVDPLTDAG